MYSSQLLVVVLWVCFAAVLYVYVGYPILIHCLARAFGRRRRVAALPDEELPAVTLLIAAYNEESVIEDRLRNAPVKRRNADSLYWKYETFLKRCEGRLGALLGANGGIYAIRKSRFVPIPQGTILDDLVIPLLSKLRHGGDIVYDPRAVADEET